MFPDVRNLAQTRPCWRRSRSSAIRRFLPVDVGRKRLEGDLTLSIGQMTAHYGFKATSRRATIKTSVDRDLPANETKMKQASMRVIAAAILITEISGCSLSPESPAAIVEEVSPLVHAGMSKSAAVENFRFAGFVCTPGVGKLNCTHHTNLFPITSCLEGVILVLDEHGDTVAAIAQREPSCFGGFG